MSSLVKPHNWSFLRKQESRKIKEKTRFPLKNCWNDGNISNVLLLMNSLVIENIFCEMCRPDTIRQSHWGLNPHMFYRQSMLFVSFMKGYDKEAFKNLILNMYKGQTFAKSYQYAYNISIDVSDARKVT